ncbi:MAG: hypothetical protein EB027_00725 [Actinobacteria bacterium]|nr:hypothetical protein [Actinomycetota bacterium]
MGEQSIHGRRLRDPGLRLRGGVQVSRGGAPIALADVQQRYDPLRGESVPTYFCRPPQWSQVRHRAYRVLDVVGMWRVPLPWWEPNHQMTLRQGPDGDTSDVASMVGTVSQSSLVLPVSRIVWRVTVREPHPTSAQVPLPVLLCEVACDSNGQWWFLRAYS